ncbi:hypothetical protein [Massilia sp. LjRoot122]|uniref:hypothetical protein n=1 Tax=Massilia sp. LjRoot122 TaxID=3342257 RepID=UPI003ECDB932
MKATQKAPAFAALHWSARTNLALMEHLQTSPTIVAGENGTAVTDDGLVVKNVHRAERINTNFEARVEAPFESWQVCRLVRRDFNFVTSKSFHRTAHRRQTGHDLRDLGYDLRLQAEFFRDDVSNLPTNPAPDVKVVPIRLFTNLGGSLYRSLLIADKAYARINYAFSNNQLSEADYQAYSKNFELAWAGIKAYLNDGQSEKTAQQLGVDQGIA